MAKHGRGAHGRTILVGIRQPTNLRERVRLAAEAVLASRGAVGPLELFCQMLWLNPEHFKQWQLGREHWPVLEPFIQVHPDKRQQALQLFLEWVHEKRLQPITASYVRAGPRSNEPLQITNSGEPRDEQFFRTHYAPANLSAPREQKLKEKLNKAPDIVVFQLTGEDTSCSECGAEILRDDMFCLEREQPLCLACADLDHLEFLARGDATLTRRARKLSPLAAVVVRFNRRQKRFERQGVLVTAESITQAESSCADDADDRAAQREKARLRRDEGDKDLVLGMTQLIRERFPGCPPLEAQQIAAHTSRRGSGRVGRSAAGRALNPAALDLAVIAWIRHQHTSYDVLLMSGHDRQAARDMIRADVAKCEAKWRRTD